MSEVKYDVSEVLISEEQLKQRVKELGAQITKDFEGEELLLVGILKGSVPFLADLMRTITLETVKLDFMVVSSYGSGTVSSGKINIKKDLETDIRGKNVIVVEDIIDSGNTLSCLKEVLLQREPKSLKIATMLDKPSRRQSPITPDYCGFAVEDKFIVGYGLDLDQKYRHLPYISWVKTE
ncbi:MAG: hypoxanthine phosphoribosyltransferase [Firmicutes bacterium]|nr:hypoxanthine phosphoribosyltransferase [Bacillota bacterium]